MTETYARKLLHASVARICHNLGWDVVQTSACDVLTDVFQRYLHQLGKACHQYSEHRRQGLQEVLEDADQAFKLQYFERRLQVPQEALEDVDQAFKLLGVRLNELKDYVHTMEPVAFGHQIPLFPVSKNNNLQFPEPGEADGRKDYIPDYMPPLVLPEEEEGVLSDMGTLAQAMHVPLGDDGEREEDEALEDDNHPLKWHPDSPDSAMGRMPSSKSPRVDLSCSPEWESEHRETHSPSNSPSSPDSTDRTLSPETSGQAPTVPSHPPESNSNGTATRKSKVSTRSRPRAKSQKEVNAPPKDGSQAGSLTSSKRKRTVVTKSPKSRKKPKLDTVKAPQPQDTENIQMSSSVNGEELPKTQPECNAAAVDDSTDAAVTTVGVEQKPVLSSSSSDSEPESNPVSRPIRPPTPYTRPQKQVESMSSGLVTPISLEPLPKADEETRTIPSADTTMKLNIKRKRKARDKGQDVGKPKEETKHESRDKSKDFTKQESEMPRAEFARKDEEHFRQKDFVGPESSVVVKSKDADVSRKDRDKHRHKHKRDRERSRKHREKRHKSKHRRHDDRSNMSSLGSEDEDYVHQRDFVRSAGSVKLETEDAHRSRKDKHRHRHREHRERHKEKRHRSRHRERHRSRDRERHRSRDRERHKERSRRHKERQDRSETASYTLADVIPRSSSSSCSLSDFTPLSSPANFPQVLSTGPPIHQDKEVRRGRR